MVSTGFASRRRPAPESLDTRGPHAKNGGYSLETELMGYAIAWLVNTILSMMIWAIIISAILSWLFAFDVINARNRFVAQIANFLDAITGPILAPFRRVIPPLGGIDLSPIVAILLINVLSILFNRMSVPFLISTLG